MASLSQAPFATSNTQQQIASPTLLSSHFSMDPSASSSPPLSSLSQPQLSSSTSSAADHYLSSCSWAQKPISYKPSTPYTNQLTAMISPSFNPPFGSCSSAFFDSYPDQAGDSLEQSFTGGDDPLLTSSWEALDKLVSTSMITASASAMAAATDQFSDLTTYMHAVPHAPISSSAPHIASPSSLSDVDQKPLSALYSNLQQNWSGSMNTNANTPTPATKVGLNLASFISSDPGFVERAAKFSSYSQQINSQQTHNNPSIVQINKNNYSIGPISRTDYNLDGPSGVRKPINSDANGANQLTRSGSSNVSLQLPDSKYNIIHVPINDSNTVYSTDKQLSAPEASVVSLSASKKKRGGSVKDREEDIDLQAQLARKRAKGEDQEDPDANNAGNNSCSKMNNKGHKSKAASSDKPKQCGISNSGESEQKSEVCNNNNKTPSSSPSPTPKPDFIHVRARRGQATDSHSLAERVRREKISERMKYLQDLVPGCTKVTGKAMMLDEIINYVQSLQRQVEFLSMKLAAVHPSKLEFNFESLFGKQVMQPPTLQNNCTALLETSTPLPLNPSSFLQADNMQSHQAFLESMHPAPSALHCLGQDDSLRGTLSMLAAASSDNFGECISQISDAWVDDDLQNVVPSLPGFLQSPLSMHSSVQGTLLNNQMKTEL
ncbi:hypothetical protein L7F22_030209 [Adiantum nelumboides]|nr:hypothetical protein [Adiantum nelumboides]